MIIIELSIIVFFHLLDILFTVLYIGKAKKEFKKAEELELNYHRWFFKKFGLIKGAFISMSISIPVIIILTLLANKYDGYCSIYLIMGMQIAIAYVNYMSWINFDKIKIIRDSKK